jgi:hypothetical protein
MVAVGYRWVPDESYNILLLFLENFLQESLNKVII